MSININESAMSEMSLIEQIKAIEAMIQYIEITLPGDINRVNEEAESAAIFFRQNGRTDLADQGVAPRMAAINTKLEDLMMKLNKVDLDYLNTIRNDLYKALNS